MQLVEALRYKQ